jgi:hypothetical protein
MSTFAVLLLFFSTADLCWSRSLTYGALLLHWNYLFYAGGDAALSLCAFLHAAFRAAVLRAARCVLTFVERCCSALPRSRCLLRF